MATAATVTDNTGTDPRQRAPLVIGDESFQSLTDTVCGIIETPLPKTPKGWYLAFGIASFWLSILGVLIVYLIATGVGVWGNQHPSMWGFPIVNFVFWIGIGHAGTLISAVLFLFRQRWRTSINRAAEAMTIFAVICAGTFPGVHIGRVWVTYWLFPIPNQMSLWPQFRSPLLWDIFAVSTYFTVSLLFWYMGMIPDLATLRDRAKTRWRQILYGVLALGWCGSSRQWHRYERAYLLLAALATPLVLSVHSVVSFDFAVSQVPGWHTTIFPPYFVAGAIFSGFAMVVTLVVPARHFFGFKQFITMRHLENMNKIILATGRIVSSAYVVEFFLSWYSGGLYEGFAFINRAGGHYAWAYWIMIICNAVVPQLFWFKSMRTSVPAMFVICILVNVGMWFERFVIVVTSLARTHVPSSWGYFTPTWVDIFMLIGSFGLFLTLFILFCRFLPFIAMSEVKNVMPQAHAGLEHENGKTHE